MSVSVRHRATALFAVLVGLLLLPVLASSAAFGHALVNATFPADGAVLDEAPDEVSLSFNEGVSAPSAAIRVFDDQGERVDAADASVDPNDPTRIRTGLQAGVDDGTYIVTWRAVSADGHPIKGAWLFSIGEGGEVGDELVEALFGGGGDTPLAITAIVIRAVALGGVLLVAGLGLFAVAVDHGSSDRLRRPAELAALAGAAAALLSIPVQAMLETGLGLGALATGPLGDVVVSPVGLSALARALLLGVAVTLLRRGAPLKRALLGPGVVGALTLALEGHSLTQDPIPVILIGDIVHVVAVAAWVGGLLGLLLLVRERRRADDPVGAARLVAGFSNLATWSLLVLTVAGVAMSWVTVRAARALTTTGYGWTLVAKVGLVAVLAVLGLYNRQRLVPAVVRAGAIRGAAGTLPVEADSAEGDDGPTAENADLARRVGDGAWIRLRQTLRLEAVVMAAVIGLTALLVGQQPASQDAGITGAYTTYVDLSDELEVNLVVDPNRAGLNEIHIYLLDRSGRPVESESIQFILEQPERDLGPFERVPEVSGPGHWSLTGRELAVAGEWTLTIVVRTDTFTEERLTIPFVVNR